MKKYIASAAVIATALVGHFEGRNLVAYLDPVSIPTICYGHTEGVRMGQVLTAKQCDDLLAADLGKALLVVNKAVKVPMPETRRAAMASFVFNVGEGNFLKSTMLKKLNAGDVLGACNELTKWNKAKGVILRGLTKRREAERKLCLQGVSMGIAPGAQPGHTEHGM